MSAPSVVARPLAEALEILKASGASAVEVRETRPPRGGPGGPLRVVRQRQTAAGLELVAATSVVSKERDESDR